MSRLFVVDANLDCANIKRNRALIEELAGTKQAVTLDLANVKYIDGSGIGALVYIKKKLRAAGHDFNVINISGQPHQMLSTLGVDQMLRTPRRRPTKLRAPAAVAANAVAAPRSIEPVPADR